jgi:hypothetical protein
LQKCATTIKLYFNSGKATNQTGSILKHNKGTSVRKKQIIVLIVAALICVIGAFLGGVYLGQLGHIYFVTKEEYSIGIYTGTPPFHFTSPENMRNPVLTADDVTDSPAQYVADPFMLKVGDTWYMFFEVMNAQTKQGDIGLATSKDGLNWNYKQIVLNEPFHVSYPYIFKWKNEYYMIPETAKAYELRLYKAIKFPTEWSFVKTLLRGIYQDPSIFYFEARWWLFVEEQNGFLHLYFTDDLMGSWTEHPESPIIKGDRNISRPGGKVLVLGDRIVRYTQDDHPHYGNAVRAFIITKLTPTSYEEVKDTTNLILKASGSGWNANGMHHLDPHLIGKDKWIACVDGYRKIFLFRLKYK